MCGCCNVVDQNAGISHIRVEGISFAAWLFLYTGQLHIMTKTRIILQWTLIIITITTLFLSKQFAVLTQHFSNTFVCLDFASLLLIGSALVLQPILVLNVIPVRAPIKPMQSTKQNIAMGHLIVLLLLFEKYMVFNIPYAYGLLTTSLPLVSLLLTNRRRVIN